MISPSKMLTFKIKKYKKHILKKYKNFKKELNQPEARLLKLLNFFSLQKIIIIVISYKYWIDLSKIGFNNVYGIFSFVSPDSNMRQIINENGSLIFKNLLIVLLIFMFVKACIFSAFNTDDYFQMIKPTKKILSSILRMGTVFLLAALYQYEVEISEVEGIIQHMVACFIIFCIYSIVEKIIYKLIRKRILNDIIEKKYTLHTDYGMLKEVPLLVLKKESNWNPYIVKANEYQNNMINNFSRSLFESLNKTEAFMYNEKLRLNKVIMNYEFQIKGSTESLDYLPGEDENKAEESLEVL